MPVDEPGGIGPDPLAFEGFEVEAMGDEAVLLTMVGAGDGDNLGINLDMPGAADLGAALVEVATGRRPEWVPE